VARLPDRDDLATCNMVKKAAFAGFDRSRQQWRLERNHHLWANMSGPRHTLTLFAATARYAGCGCRHHVGTQEARSRDLDLMIMTGLYDRPDTDSFPQIGDPSPASGVRDNSSFKREFYHTN